MLDATTSAPASDSETSVVNPAGPVSPARPPTAGPRSARKKKRGLFHRTGVVVPALVMAVLLVVGVLAAAKMLNKDGTGASGLFQSIDSLGTSAQVTALEQERQTIIAMNDAAETLTVVSKPAQADPTQILAAQQAANSSTSDSGIQTGTGITGSAPPADPTSAEQIGEAELVDFGYSKAGQWTCLYELWQQESGWNVYAENPSGAYGIPQSLPGDKMASAGSDWQTDPRTQIIWGLGYIKSVYGTPCGAWSHEKADGYY
jgi:transglycosylase-like protein with SLT domain